MSWTILSIWLVRLFWWLFKGLFVTWFSLKFIWILWVLVFWLLLYPYLVLLECIFIRWWSLEWYFWLTIYVILSCACTWSWLDVWIFLRLESWFVTALAFKFCSAWFVLICWLLFYNNGFWLIAIFIWSIRVERDMWLVFYVRLSRV